MRTMNFKSTILAGIGVVVGVLAGVSVVGPVLGAVAQNQIESSRPDIPISKQLSNLPSQAPFPKNSAGMTYGYGVAIDARNPGPDLVAAIGVNGTQGFVKASDRPGSLPPPANPEAALRTIRTASYLIPLYAVDCKTVIGEFRVEAGVPVENLE